MIDTQAIRNKVLDLALNGQLTEQLPEDGTAEELYQQIQEEKQKLIKEGKVNKQKQLPEIAAEEIPFEIPNNWKWIRWGELSFRIQYGYNAPAQQTGRIKMVRITDIQNNKVIWESVPYCDIDQERIEEYQLEPNNILFARTGGTVGKSFLVEKVENEAVFAGYLIRTSFSSMLSAKYMKYFMESQLYWKQLRDGTTATAQPNCNAKTLSKMMVPLPPFAEQVRIVEKIDKTFSILDTIDELQSKYTDNLSVLKSKLIDAAIQGKLTEQLSDDGTAEELFQQIQKEKQKLINEGKIKKEKALPEISEEEIPFKIPANWKWVRLGEYCQKVTDQVASGSFASLRENVRSLKTPDYAIMVKTSDFANGFTENLTYTDKHGYEFLANSNLFGGELILSNVGSVGKIFIVPKLKKKMTLAPNAVMVKMVQEEGKDFLYYFLLSAQGNKELEAISTGIAVKKFNKTELKKILIPLPPASEQKRIVRKINELISIFEA
ncbi:MAG: restriction endonuclease subunit S [Erysipelotrichaceae bacterium]|nr:restriction endonuclease subunit S [Erysipelotrichaceae bacterium]